MIQPDPTSKIHPVSLETNSGPEITCSVYSSFAEIAGLQEEWDLFVAEAGGEIFLTFDWCQIWWKHYGRNRFLQVFVFRKNQSIVGILPLFSERIWLGPVFVDAVKIVGSDFTLAQFTLPIQSEYFEPVFNLFFKFMLHEKWDVINIGPLAGLYHHTAQLKNTLKKSFNHTCQVFVKEKREQIYFHLADNWEEQLTKMDKSDQKDIARSYRRLQKIHNDPAINVEMAFAAKENFSPYFNDFVEMHQAYWRKQGKAGHFEDWPGALDFHREMAQKQLSHNRLHLIRIFIKHDTLGFEYSYWFGKTCYELLAGRSTIKTFSNISVGKINYCEKMQNLLQNHIYLIDSMRGKYEYKLKLGGQTYPINSLYIVSKNRLKYLRVLMFNFSSRILNICYYKVWFLRLACLLPFKRRPLWRIWIRTNFMDH